MSPRVRRLKFEMGRMIPSIYNDLFHKLDNANEYYVAFCTYGNTITELINRYFTSMEDMEDLYNWMKLDTGVFKEKPYENCKNIIEFLDVYSLSDAGLTIVDKLTTDLFDLKKENKNEF